MNVKIFRRLACLLCLFLPSAVQAAFLPLSNTADEVVNENIQPNEEYQEIVDPEITIPIDEEDEYKTKLFLCAARKGQIEIAKLLKEQGANTNAKDNYGKNALHYVCLFSDSVEMVTWLLDVCQIGLETKECTEMTPFLFAAEEGQHAIAKLLKERGANTNAKDSFDNNALHLACAFSGSVKVIEWLLDVCQIGIETKGYNQKTPFLCTAQRGELAIAQLLKKRGANIRAKDNYGKNALHYACLFSGSVEMVTWLLDVCKIGLESKGYAQRTPFLCAARKGQIEIAKLLKERGANTNAKDSFGNNALDLAKRHHQSQEIVNWLSDECNLQETTWFNGMLTWIISFIY